MVNLNPIVAVVDDDESVCRAIKRLLRAAGIDAETFSGGDEFLNALSTDPSYRPACVVLDVQMPGTGGLEVQRRLVPLGLPVVMITAHDEPSVRVAALASGAVAYLRKPFDAASLIEVVQAAIGGAPRA
ncbi:response regulator transcription factor [Paraburkholderia ginsengisoli]|uniref:Response regulator n=1 Tax=Paraburkholderia ginsengisoli TaxID=311231 RepID=A0A7T4N842_9BURK|nr:response regulator [Paraburkholderia ginsengisoli]QQC66956.1 response regulator [Paraburkholderia ginsengisoli]